MASVNLATKYSPKVSERLKKATIIGGLTNRNYDWVDVDTVKLYSVDTFDMHDYDRNSAQGYGDPQEATTSLQTWQVAQDRAFTGKVDKLNDKQSMGVLKPGSILARQIREEVVPEVDAYVLQVMATAGVTASRDGIVTDAATTKDNAWTNLVTLKADIVDNEGKDTGLFAAMTSDYYSFLLQSGFVLASDKGQSKNESGNLGTIDGMKPRLAPSSRMPSTSGTGSSNIDLLIVHPEVTTFADVLTDYNIITRPEGFSGVRINGRVAYDAFVDTNKVNEIAIHATS
jgi:hypothetical protein